MVGAKYWNIGGIIGVSPVPQAFKLVTVEGHVHFICPRIDDLKISLNGRAITIPCGTPDRNAVGCDTFPSTATDWCLLLESRSEDS